MPETTGPAWPRDKANHWYAGQPWRFGCNFIPSSAVNQIEMWQADSFDPGLIDRELGLAASIGMNSVRVFLHDLLFCDDREGFLARIERFLGIAARHGLATMPVLFDSCWQDEPRLGPQQPPTPGVHNSGWVQSPGMAALADSRQHPRLKAYVEGIVSHFRDDPRILCWDIWNEPDNGPDVARANPDELAAKAALVVPVLCAAFGWARGQAPVQPLTSGIWLGDWSSPNLLSGIQSAQITQSDVISFHNYGGPEDFARRAGWLKVFERPLLCTEFMARPIGSTFAAILPVARELKVGAWSWGLVRGKTQTHLPWDSWQRPYVDLPPGQWFHDIFEPDGTAHDPDEVALIRSLTGVPAPAELQPQG